ncbi:MAG: hypothetical protein ACRELA_06180 [Candidatus Rokuibacteriota bacterium]
MAPATTAIGNIMRGLHMKRFVSVGLLALGLAGCAARSARPVESYGTHAEPSPAERSAAGTILSVIGTPFFLAFKAAVCAATVVIAAPTAAILGLTDRAYEARQRQDLDEGFAKNCGPPYVLP